MEAGNQLKEQDGSLFDSVYIREKRNVQLYINNNTKIKWEIKVL